MTGRETVALPALFGDSGCHNKTAVTGLLRINPTATAIIPDEEESRQASRTSSAVSRHIDIPYTNEHD